MRVVRQVSGHQVTFGGTHHTGWLPPTAAEPLSATAVLDLQILEEDGAFVLVCTSDHPHFAGGDTWHATFEEAVEQAHTQFGVPPGAWLIPA